MSQKNGIDAKISKFGNFTINRTNSKIDCGYGIKGNQLDIKADEPRDIITSKGKAQVEGKAPKRVPLGECQQQNRQGLGANRDSQIPSKKKVEKFEVFVDENEAENEEDYPEGSSTDGGSTFSEKGNHPAAPQRGGTTSALNLSYHTSGESCISSREESDEDDEVGLGTPSEYITVHSTTTFYSAVSSASIPEKNSMFVTYDLDVFKWMLFREQSNRPKSSYMLKQSCINADMRTVLVDWFVDVIAEYELSLSTFFLAVSLTDRTLSVIDCPHEKLQLLGSACLLVAAKMHEINAPLIKEIVYMTADSYSEEQVQRMERIVLKVSDFQLGLPLVDSFAEFFNYTASIPLSTFSRNLMWYLLELSALDLSCIRFPPSRLAAAAFVVSSFVQLDAKDKGIKIWSSKETLKTGISRRELSEPAQMLLQLHSNASRSKAKAISKKYSSSTRFKVAAVRFPSVEQIASQFDGD